MQIIVDGLLTQYSRAGTGPIVLILPGWADSSRSWLQVQKQLAAQYDVVVLDLPGFGGTQQPPSAWGLNEYVIFIKDFLQKLGLSELHGLVGHSNGGGMAIRGLAGDEIQAQKLVLIASAGIRNQQTGRKAALKVVAKTGKALTRPLPERLRKRLRARLYASAGSDMLVAEHMQESFKKVITDDVQKDAAQLRLPVLLLYGEADTDAPVAYGQTFQGLIPGSVLKVIPGAGHFLHLEEDTKIVEEIREFL